APTPRADTPFGDRAHAPPHHAVHGDLTAATAARASRSPCDLAPAPGYPTSSKLSLAGAPGSPLDVPANPRHLPLRAATSKDPGRTSCGARSQIGCPDCDRTLRG